MSDPVIPAALMRSLGQLPEFEPDPALWSRIEHSVEVRARKRRTGGWLAAGLAASLSLVSASALLRMPAESGSSDIAELLRRSQALELQLIELRDGQADAPVWMDEIGRSERVELALLDQRIAIANEDDSREELWEQRNALLQRLVIAYREPVLVTQL